ncbi:MAG: [protein-PII] uridylyltransferase [Methylococcales bacterium]|nr:[protein-PII] uridylyltransferase [Methylococcales bacterium]
MNKYINASIFKTSDPLLQFKSLLKQKEIELNLKFNPQESVSGLLKEKSDFVDLILKCCWDHFLGQYANQLALCAVGGYGRRELFPHSDIDILILLDDDNTEPYQEALSQLFTFLWDIGLKPGHSVRTIDDCVNAAFKDQTIMTSLMEFSLIAGEKSLFNALKLRITPDSIWPSDQFFAAKMEEQRLRYAKFHETAYNLEPNIKEGPGGLRDMQVIAWVFKRHYNSSTLKELIKYGFLPESEYAELIAAREVLWRIRYALHLLTNRAENRLIFDYQRDLAEQFGFSSKDQYYNQDVEQFMQFYFKTVQGLERLNEMLLQLFSERFVNREKANKSIEISTNFIAINGYIEAIDDQLFVKNPLAFLEVFLLLQQHANLMGIRANTIRLIRKNLHIIDDNFRQNKDANKLFLDIFRQPSGLTHALRRMNRYGVLAAYLPHFANIVARMQYDLFHIYTVDEHTLFVIRNLRRLSLEQHSHEFPLCRNVYKTILKPEILYIAALFHDIAKGLKGDHSTIGEDIAREFCLQHDLSKYDTDLIAWLVKSHLIMSMTAQRKDISDPDIIHEFAQKVGNIDYLKHLYLLTVADIRATNPELWNDWKDSLLNELYKATYQALEDGLQNPATLSERILENKQYARDELLKLGMNDSTIDVAWQHTNDDYFLRYSTDEIAWHTQAIASSSETDLPLVLLHPKTQHGSAEVFIYTKEKGPIFSISTATLDQLGLTILDARIITTQDHYVLNSFQILEQSGEPINESYREAHICSALRNNLLNGSVKDHINIHRLSKSRQAIHFPIPTSVKFLIDPLNRNSIIEIVTTDRAGLLSIIGKAFIQENINLLSAKISTIGSRAEDVFYITDLQLQPINDKEKQNQICTRLINLLNN